MEHVRCPHCNINWSVSPPVRFDEIVPGPYLQRFRPGSGVRCVGCKSEFILPIAIGVNLILREL